VALLAVGLQRFLGWLYGQSTAEGPPRRWRKRWTAAILAAVVLMFAAGIAAIGITHQTAWLLNSPEPIALRGSYRQVQSMANLKQIAISCEAYNDALREGFPPGGTVDKFGRGMHGWQTLLLPYIEQNPLFESIDLDKPWNHPDNAKAMRREVQIYLHSRDSRRETDYAHSHYAANVRVIGGTVPRDPRTITDGLSTTILAGEVPGNFKPWGHPRNWRDPALGLGRTLDGFGGPGTGVTVFSFADGSVRTLRNNISPAVLKALSTPDGGEIVTKDY
jgi:hypothetical protein